MCSTSVCSQGQVLSVYYSARVFASSSVVCSSFIE